MSEESPSSSTPRVRPLRPHERKLIKTLLGDRWPRPELDARLDAVEVEDMLDGGMGSIRFRSNSAVERRLGQVISEAEYVDDDGVPVSLALNTDDRGELFELDVWKLDFSPLRRYPDPAELTVRRA